MLSLIVTVAGTLLLLMFALRASILLGRMKQEKEEQEALFGRERAILSTRLELADRMNTGLERELRGLLREIADMKFELGSMRGQGKVALLEDGDSEGWAIDNDHEVEVQNSRRGGSVASAEVVKGLFSE